MRFQINTGAIRAFRLWLAARIAPAGADIHMPAETVCPGDVMLLSEVAWNQVFRLAGGQLVINVGTGLADLEQRGLLHRDEIGRPVLTDAGALTVAGMWGDDRVPPWGAGTFHCPEHGTYQLRPGDLRECPQHAINAVRFRAFPDPRHEGTGDGL